MHYALVGFHLFLRLIARSAATWNDPATEPVDINFSLSVAATDGSQAVFDNYLQRHPVLAPFHAPTYSNAAFALLAYALENITNQSFPDLFRHSLVEPLQLNSTTYSLPEDSSSSIIPVNSTASRYDGSFEEEAPAGEYYSTIKDMAKFGRSILNSTLLPQQ